MLLPPLCNATMSIFFRLIRFVWEKLNFYFIKTDIIPMFKTITGYAGLNMPLGHMGTSRVYEPTYTVNNLFK